MGLGLCPNSLVWQTSRHNREREIKVKAAVFREINVPMEIEDIQVAKPGPREVLIRTGAAGICHSDMHFF